MIQPPAQFLLVELFELIEFVGTNVQLPSCVAHRREALAEGMKINLGILSDIAGYQGLGCMTYYRDPFQ